MYSMLFGNNSGGGANALLDGASFYLELTHTAIPQRAASGTTATFTRATTSTWPNNDGYLVTGLSGEIGFPGARRVRNLTKTNSEDFGVAFTTVNGGNSASGTTLTFAGGLNTYILQSNNTGIIAGRTYCYSVYLKAGTKAGTIKFGNQTNGEFSAPITPTATLTRYQFTNISAGPGFVGFVNSTADTGTVIAERFQIEDVTGQADQTAGEYVSVGVESAPAYHGSMVDGVKCYSTDRSGNPISTSGSYPLVGYVPWEARTNSKLQSNSFTTNGAGAPWGVYGTPTATQNLVGPDGTTSGWTLTDNAAGGTEAIWQVVTLTAAFWADSIFVKKTTGAQASYPVFSADNGTLISAVTIDTSNGVATSWTGYTGLTIATGSTARITSWNADWWRVENVFTGTAAAWNFVYHTAGTTNPTQAAGVVDLTAQGSMGIAFSQTELGSFATPYIPTTTDAVARNASVEAVTTSGAILAAGGTISLTYIPYHAPSGTIALWGTYVDASNYTAILHDATNLIFRKRIAGSNYDATIANAFTSGTTYKMTASWGAGGSTIYLNGVAGTPHANTTAAQIAATMQFGADGNSLQQPGAAVIKNYIWQRQLSGSEQAAVTA